MTGDYWLLKLIAAPLLGLGFGGLSMSFNTLFVTHFSQKNAGLLNVLNATYGLGAVAAPWLLSQGLLTGSELLSLLLLRQWLSASAPGTLMIEYPRAQLLHLRTSK